MKKTQYLAQPLFLETYLLFGLYVIIIAVGIGTLLTGDLFFVAIHALFLVALLDQWAKSLINIKILDKKLIIGKTIWKWTGSNRYDFGSGDQDLHYVYYIDCKNIKSIDVVKNVKEAQKEPIHKRGFAFCKPLLKLTFHKPLRVQPSFDKDTSDFEDLKHIYISVKNPTKFRSAVEANK